MLSAHSFTRPFWWKMSSWPGQEGKDCCLSLSRPQLWPPYWGGGFLPILSREQGRQEEPSGNVWLMERQIRFTMNARDNLNP